MTAVDELFEDCREILKQRHHTYGDPRTLYKRIAALKTKHMSGAPDAADTIADMIVHKAARLKTSPKHRDHYIDIINYVALIWLVETQ